MAKRILISGMTGPNVNGQMKRTQVYTQSHMYRLGLQKLGYTVNNLPPKETQIQQLVAEHDEFLIGLAQTGSIMAGWRIHALALIGEILTQSKKLVTFVDDWQFQAIKPCLLKLKEDNAKGTAIRDVKMTRLPEGFYEQYESRITLALDYLISGDHTMLASIIEFGNSNEEFFQLSKNPIFLDVSCYQPIPKIDAQFKAKRWVIAGLRDYTKYVQQLNIKWPVKHCGETVDGKFHSIKEEEVFKELAHSQGMLIPTYSSSKTNWWRPRYLFARAFNNVIYAEPGTTGKYDVFNVAPEKIELMDSTDLHVLKREQKKTLDNIIWSEQKFLTKLMSVF